MKSMIWKELRENFKWAVLALLCLTLAEFYTLSSQRQTYVEDYRDVTICSSAFLLVTSFGCSAIGIALAVVQILPELRRDQWAALLHRPVSRGVIFFGKVVAGMLLYFGAATLPFMASVAYVATPGQFAAPLVPGMVLPGLSDLLIGPVFYFATILLCLHRGRWFGSRGVIGLSVVPIFLLHITIGWPFLLPLLAIVLYLFAALGAMISNGSLRDRPWVARTAFVFVVLMGAETILLFIILGLQFLPSKSTGPSPLYTEFRVTQDDKVFIASQRGNEAAVLTDLNGKVVTDPKYIGNNNGGENFLQILPLSWRLKINYTRDSRDAWTYVHVQDERQGKEVWYLLPKQNYFIGYDKLSRRVAGICDAGGFRPAGVTPKPFPIQLRPSILSFQEPHLYWSGTELLSLDFSERNEFIFNAANDIIYGAANVNGGYLQDKPARIAVALKNNIRILTSQGTPVLTIRYPHDPAMWSFLSMGTNDTADRLYVESAPTPGYWDPNPLPNSPNEPIFLDEFDLHGNILHTYSRPDIRIASPPPDWRYRLLVLTSPFAPALLGTIYSHIVHATGPASSASVGELSLPEPSLRMTATELGIIFVLAVILGLVTFFWARRMSFSARRARLWTLFVFCFGLPGFLAFRLASDWPTRVRCPQCGRKRPIETEECSCCHEPWPLPRSSGAEIFDGPLEENRSSTFSVR